MLSQCYFTSCHVYTCAVGRCSRRDLGTGAISRAVLLRKCVQHRCTHRARTFVAGLLLSVQDGDVSRYRACRLHEGAMLLTTRPPRARSRRILTVVQSYVARSQEETSTQAHNMQRPRCTRFRLGERGSWDDVWLSPRGLFRLQGVFRRPSEKLREKAHHRQKVNLRREGFFCRSRQ